MNAKNTSPLRNRTRSPERASLTRVADPPADDGPYQLKTSSVYEEISGRDIKTRPDGSPHKFFNWEKEDDGYKTRTAFLEIEKQIDERRRRLDRLEIMEREARWRDYRRTTAIGPTQLDNGRPLRRKS